MQGFSCRLHKIHVNIYKVEINSLSSFGHLLNNICYYEKHGLIWYVGFCGSGWSGDYFFTLFTKLYLNISIFTHWALLNYYLQWKMTARQNLTFKSVNIFLFFIFFISILMYIIYCNKTACTCWDKRLYKRYSCCLKLVNDKIILYRQDSRFSVN